jgi:hypothetical protein
VTQIREDYYVVSETEFGRGDFFLEIDLLPYLKEERKEKLLKLKKL